MRRLVSLALLLSACTKESAPVQVEAAAPATAPAATKAALPKVSRSLVTVSCGDISGPGFFSSPEIVVTRRRFVCDAPRVKLHDGRTLLGKVRNKWLDLDLAELAISGGEGEPLPIASAVTLSETTDLWLAAGGSGSVRAPLVTRLGVPHFEAAFDKVPAPGSIVLDAKGAVLGLTTDAVHVLPLDVLLPSWGALLQNAKPALAKELATLRRALGKPGLVTALVDKNGTLHVVLLSYTAAPRVTLGGCNVELEPAWEKFRLNAWLDEPTRELFQFLDAHDLDIGLSMSTVAVPTAACGTGELFLDGADPLLHAAPIGKTDKAMAVTADSEKALAPPPPAPPRGKQPGELDATDERIWRGRFSALREERELFEKDLRAKQRFIDDADRAVRRSSFRYGGGVVLPVLTPEEKERYDQYKRDLEEAARERAEFQRRLDDLEREASRASVPREWRQ